MTMRLGNAAWGLRETPLDEQLRITRDMGLGLLELSIAGYARDFLQTDATPDRIAEVGRLFRSWGISPECGCTGNDFTGNDADRDLEKLKKVISIAAQVGVRQLRIFAGFHSDSVVFGARFDKMLACLTGAARFASAHGIRLAVETHGGVVPNGDALVHFGSVTTRVDTWPAILATGVSINYDPANLAAVGAVDPVAFYRQFAESITYMHLKDFKRVPGGVVPAACGEGGLDWVRFAEAVADYDGPALLEYEAVADVEDGLRRSLAFWKRVSPFHVRSISNRETGRNQGA